MKLFWAGAAAALAVMAGGFAPAERGGDIDPMTVSAIAPARDGGQTFRLQVDGREKGCVVAVADRRAGRRPLSVDPACADDVPGLAAARWWFEREDGSVAFTTDDGQVAVEFAIADGAAYESYAPRRPIMTLIGR